MEGYHFQLAHLKKYYESQSVYYLEIGIYDITKEEIENEFIPILESYLNETLDVEIMKTPMHQLGYTYLVLKHHTRYFVQYGVCQCAKESIACGKNSSKRCEFFRFYLYLCHVLLRDVYKRQFLHRFQITILNTITNTTGLKNQIRVILPRLSGCTYRMTETRVESVARA